jgi:L-lactate permease
MFGSVQQAAAVSIGIRPEIILSLQLAGASLGNAYYNQTFAPGMYAIHQTNCLYIFTYKG